MTVGQLRALLADLPDDALIKFCDPIDSSILSIDDVGYNNDLGHYVIWGDRWT
jgi:hypothetical protein